MKNKVLQRSGKLIDLSYCCISIENLHEISYQQKFCNHGNHVHFSRQNVGPISPKKIYRNGPVHSDY